MGKDRVRDWMTTSLITIGPDDTVREAYYLMKDHFLRRLLVVEEEKLVGLLSLADVQALVSREPLDPFHLGFTIVTGESHKHRVKEIMQATPATIAPDATIQEAARVMLDHQVQALPVVEDGNLVGILTDSDIFRQVCNTAAAL